MIKRIVQNKNCLYKNVAINRYLKQRRNILFTNKKYLIIS
jgi:hypothetical protein